MGLAVETGSGWRLCGELVVVKVEILYRVQPVELRGDRALEAVTMHVEVVHVAQLAWLGLGSGSGSGPGLVVGGERLEWRQLPRI